MFRKRHAELKDQPEFWKKCVEKVKRIEEDYRKSDISVDIQVEKLCVELHPDSLSDSDELECMSTETSDIEELINLITDVFFVNIERLLLVIIIQGVPEICDSQGYTAWSVTYFCFCKSVLRNSIVPQCALDCCRFFGTPCILYSRGGTHDIFGRGCATIKSLYRPFLEFLTKKLDPFRNFCA